jgi:hypothetical protein
MLYESLSAVVDEIRSDVADAVSRFAELSEHARTATKKEWRDTGKTFSPIPTTIMMNRLNND